MKDKAICYYALEKGELKKGLKVWGTSKTKYLVTTKNGFSHQQLINLTHPTTQSMKYPEDNCIE